jgi:predicted ATP-grasp superfamily ATP-dependent carboligase
MNEYEHLLYLTDPVTDSPVLLVHLEGWIDAGLGGSTAMATLLETLDTTMVATFDTEYFIDQRARRPVVRIVDGITTDLTWPEIQLRHGVDPDGADVLLLVGPEPDFHWSDFAELVLAICEHFGVRLVVGLGAFPGPAPHTRPIRVIGVAPEPSAHLLEAVGVMEGEIQVPSGILTAVEMVCAENDIDAMTLWARVPHYVASMPYPQASAALLDAVAAVTGLTVSSAPLREAAEQARRRVDDLVTNNPEHESMVADLEETADDEGTPLGVDIPTGDELAAELERFLRGEAE